MRLFRNSRMIFRLTKIGTAPSNAISWRLPLAQAKGMRAAEGWCFRTHAQNSLPLPLAYSPPSCSSLNTARMRSLPSTDILSNDENSERLSRSSSFR